MPPQLIINNCNIRYVSSSKVLGLIIDENLDFSEHAINKLKECNKKWGLIIRNTTRNHRLNIRSLTLLLRALILTKMHYAAPLWLYKNLHLYKEFWNKVVLKISGAMLNPNRDLVELEMQLPPLNMQLEVLTVKFLCKVISDGDFLISLLLQVDGLSFVNS